MQQQQRRICWPDPDATCLEGGCIYCNDNPFKPVSTIAAHVAKLMRTGETVSNRGNGKEVEPDEAFRYGQLRGWNNAESRTVEV